MKKLLTISLALLSLVSIGCEASGHENHSGIQSSISDRKSNATDLNLMLDEVFKTRITDITSQRADVSHIVSKYLYSGMDKKEISDLISNQFEILEETDNKLFALYKKGEGYLGNRRDFYIELFFSKEGKLLKNKSYLDKSNNI
ncbi:hypothetical protein QP437_04615 [Haemophilus sp. UMB1048]|uniref:hypothetical protein n=1 Tax=Haemophilus sp. UMB1048 TaxID=3046322 RepID=UPI0025570C02|nr:hypothetical protein [Haemophilus sp. UMB1048]MDK7254158.1 hypothetical protein [Haemophilus sp. UMB1048]